MKPDQTGLRLLLVGALPRLAMASLMVGLLWIAFFWATATPGAL